MTNRIDSRFSALRAAGRPGLITFVTAGDPDPALTVEVLHALVRHGADLVELGMPFSDPMADGPVIQQANERALARHVGLTHVIDSVRQFRTVDRVTPIILMGYLNPIERFGFERFATAAAAAGADGLLLVDCPIEESGNYEVTLKALGLEQIFLLAPTTPLERRQRIAAKASGFLYYVSFKGITGAGHLEHSSAIAALDELRGLSDVPIAVGFGIRDGATAAALGAHAEAIVIGSALVESIAAARDAAEVDSLVASFLNPIRDALRAVKRAT
jgi:tryptophan synthase alpha chain